MPDQNHTQQPGHQQQGQGNPPQQQGQSNSPFKDIEDREKRIFKIRRLNTSPGTENISYEVLLDEKENGSIETTHVNRKFFSKGGYEILPTTVTGMCSACGDVTLAEVLKNCNCGKHLCPQCRQKVLGQYCCKWRCAFLVVGAFVVKRLATIIIGLFGILLRLIVRLIIIPFRDIHKG